MITLTALRQAVGKDLNECHVGRLAAVGSYYIKDTALVDSDENPSRWDRSWLLLFTEGGLAAELRRVRRTDGQVKGYDPLTGILQFQEELVELPEVGSEYEIHSLLSPSTLNELIDNGLRRCTYLSELVLDIVRGSREYDLSEYEWLKRPEQVVNAEWMCGTEPERYRLPMDRWRVTKNDTGLTFHPSPLAPSTEVMVLTVIKPYGEQVWHTTGTNCPEEWAKAAAILEVYTWLMRNAPAEDVKRYSAARNEAALKFYSLSQLYAPRPARRVQLAYNV